MTAAEKEAQKEAEKGWYEARVRGEMLDFLAPGWRRGAATFDELRLMYRERLARAIHAGSWSVGFANPDCNCRERADDLMTRMDVVFKDELARDDD